MPDQQSAQGMVFDAQPTQTDMVFDSQPVQQTTPASMSSNAPGLQQQSAQTSAQPQPASDSSAYYIRATPQPKGHAERLEQFLDDARYDIMHGTGFTSVGHILQKAGFKGLAAGQGEGAGEFMGSLPLGLMRAVQGGAQLPQSGKRWEGTKNVVGGLADASTIPGGFVAPEAGEVAGQGAELLLSQAERAAKAAHSAFSTKAIQPKVQNAIIQAIKDTAQEHGIDVPSTVSMRDVVQHLSDNVRGKAHAIYRQLDTALGGKRFQIFDEQLQNVEKAIRNSLGIDPEKDAALAKRLEDITAARNTAMDEIRAKGLDPDDLIGKADKLHQRAMALQDVSKAVRAATDAHPSIAKGDTVPANVRTGTLFKKMQGLATPNPKYPGSPSRLTQALGEQRAAELLNAVDAAHLYAQKIAARNRFIKNAAKTLGLGTLGYEAVSGAHRLLSEAQ